MLEVLRLKLLEERAARLAQGRGVPQPAPGRHLAPAPSGQLPGQLPDLNPAAVNVVQKDKHGKAVFHYKSSVPTFRTMLGEALGPSPSSTFSLVCLKTFLLDRV